MNQISYMILCALTINQENITNFHIIHKIIIIYTNSVIGTDSSFDSEVEFLALPKYYRLWNIPTPYLRALQ